MVRLNITLPDDLGKELKKVSNKSRFYFPSVKGKAGKRKKAEIG